MTSHITQALADTVARAALQLLGFNDKVHAEVLLNQLDEFLKDYATGNEVNGAEPCSKKADEEALADIAKAWLDESGRGSFYWPCQDPGRYPGHLRYDDHDHDLIVGQVKILVCALNRARQSIEGDTAQHIQNLAYFEPEYAHKRYTALAQATLLSIRKHEKLGVATCLSDYYLCRALSPLLDSTDGTTEALIDTLSDKFQLQLREFKVAALPDIFFPLRLLNSRAQQAEAVVPSLGFLKNIGIISEIGHSDEERLQFAAQACGELCFANHFELPAGLSDAMLPDLLAKFAIMELARQP